MEWYTFSADNVVIIAGGIGGTINFVFPWFIVPFDDYNDPIFVDDIDDIIDFVFPSFCALFDDDHDTKFVAVFDGIWILYFHQFVIHFMMIIMSYLLDLSVLW